MSAPYDRPEKSSYSNEPGPNKKPCRACTDFQSWMNMYGKSEKKQGNQSSSTSTAAGKTDGAEAGNQIGKDCPLDKDELGTNTWSFLHTMAAYYPERPSQQQQKDMKDMMYLFGKFYPCDFCAEDFRKDIKKNEPDTKDQHSFSQWMCNRHNEVNRKLGKPEFDCRLVNERWRDGWKDGSCD